MAAASSNDRRGGGRVTGIGAVKGRAPNLGQSTCRIPWWCFRLCL